MHGSLDPEERVMKESSYTEDALVKAVATLGWDVVNDDIHVEIGGTSIYEIDGAGTKWAPLKGTRKYNKDAFIVIKNRSRNPTIPSVNDDPERVAHHAKVEESNQPSDSDNDVGQPSSPA